MSQQPPTPTATNVGAKTFVSFVLGIGLGLALVAPVYAQTLGPVLSIEGMESNSVLLLGLLGLTVLVGVLIVAFQALFSNR